MRSPGMQRHEWIEDGQLYHTWKIKSGRGYIYTNDVGIQQLNDAIKRDLENGTA